MDGEIEEKEEGMEEAMSERVSPLSLRRQKRQRPATPGPASSLLASHPHHRFPLFPPTTERSQPLHLQPNMVNSSTIVDKRGYLFRFPTLGLPEPGAKGEDVVIRAAIGIKEKALPLLKDDKVEAARRYTGNGTVIFDVQYEGAVWVLPLLVPLKPAPETELFTLRVRRILPSKVPDPHRLKLPNTLGVFYMEHPMGMPSMQIPSSLKDQLKLPEPSNSVPTEADEEQYWDDDLTDLLGAVDLDRDNVPEEEKMIVSSHLSGGQNTYTPEEEAQRLKPPQAMTEAWQTKVVMQAMMDKMKATGSIPATDPFVRLRGSAGGDEVWFEYAMVWSKDGANPPEEEWKRVPSEAWKPGCELILVNQHRKKLGMEPLTKAKLTRAHVAAAGSSSTRCRE